QEALFLLKPDTTIFLGNLCNLPKDETSDYIINYRIMERLPEDPWLPNDGMPMSTPPGFVPPLGPPPDGLANPYERVFILTVGVGCSNSQYP
ncbi:MAG TPA: hypothetical protein VFN10_23670, partial [Thermoanaerobaculia bacterium]|nr:hypothetical protein [Thermoanaerobaculia bacterium]